VGHVTSFSPILAEPVGLGLIAQPSTLPGTRLGVIDGTALGRPARLGEQLADAPTIASLEIQPRFPK